MIRQIGLQLCFILLTTLRVVGAGHATESVMIPHLESDLMMIQTAQPNTDSQILRSLRQFHSHGKIQENLVEYPAERTSPKVPPLLNRLVVHQDLVNTQFALARIDKISLINLRRLIFPFHTFW